MGSINLLAGEIAAKLARLGTEGFFPSVPARIYLEPNRFFAVKTPVVELIDPTQDSQGPRADDPAVGPATGG